MDEIKRPINQHKAYHAHIYFDADTLATAKQIGADVAERFGLRIGRYHEQPVGPHPDWSVQITFAAKHFDEFIPWLDEHRQGLNVLVHGVTGDDLRDHTEFAYWLGEPVELKLAMFGHV